MTNDVASVAFRSTLESYLAICRQRGQTPTNLFNALSFDQDSFDLVPFRDWHSWTVFLHNLDAAIRDLCTLDELQTEWAHHTPSLGPFRGVLALFVSPEQVVQGVWNWSGPRMFRCVIPTCDTLSVGILRLGLRLQPGFTPSTMYFRFSALSATRLPTLLGLPAATIVNSEISATHIDLTIKLPASRSVFSRLARCFKPSSKALLSEALASSQREHREDRVTLDALIDSSLDGVIIGRPDSVYTINPAARRILALGPSEVLSDNLSRLLFAEAGSDTDGTRLVRLGAGTDQERWIQVWMPRGLDARDNARITVIRDVTDSEVLRRQFERLQRYAAVGEIGAILGHEITTSLAAIMSDLQWCLEDDKQSVVSPKTRATLERTQNNARHLVNVARTLLNPARSDAPPPGVQDVCHLVRQAADIATYVAKGSGVNLHVQIPSEPVKSFCRPGDVVQILINLLTNAIEASRHSDRKEVCVYVANNPPVIEVHDYGAGLPEDLVATWGNIQSTRRPGGHGLGLLISKKLAEKNGAKLSYDRLPHGTTIFGLKLPSEHT